MLEAIADAWKNRHGEVETMGESTSTSFNIVDAAKVAYAKKCYQIKSEGFLLTREATYDASHIDFDQLTNEIREGARKAFDKIRTAHPDQKINSLCLFSDESAMTIAHCANSKEALIAAGGDEDLVWNAAEWSFNEGGEFLDVAYRMILPFHLDGYCKMEFAEFRDAVFEACVSALEQLDKEKFFGSGKDREDVVLLFEVSDSDEVESTVKRLNTTKAFSRYKKWASSWQ